MKASCPVLVVDDEAVVRESLAGWLGEDGYAVDTATDGRTALAKLAERPYAVVLADLKMPGMDGLQLLAEARARWPHLVIILMTAYATVETAVRAMKEGAHDYLLKPFDPEVLSRMVERVARRRATAQGDLRCRDGLTRTLPPEDA
jgi:DNA-binding NtrC family response regulator